MRNIMDEFYTPKQVAESLQVSTRTIINLIKNGKMNAVIVGGSTRNTYRIYQKELDRFMAENYHKSSKEEDE